MAKRTIAERVMPAYKYADAPRDTVLSVRLESDLANALRALAVENGTSCSRLIELALVDFAKAHKIAPTRYERKGLAKT